MNGYCNYECGNKTPYGTCALTACTNPKYNGFNKTDLTSNLYQVNVPQTAPTHKSVLLERWAKDTREMAISRIQLDTLSGECTVDHDGRTVYYQNYEAALDGEIAYLNSAAEVEA